MAKRQTIFFGAGTAILLGLIIIPQMIFSCQLSKYLPASVDLQSCTYRDYFPETRYRIKAEMTMDQFQTYADSLMAAMPDKPWVSDLQDARFQKAEFHTNGLIVGAYWSLGKMEAGYHAY